MGFDLALLTPEERGSMQMCEFSDECHRHAEVLEVQHEVYLCRECALQRWSIRLALERSGDVPDVRNNFVTYQLLHEALVQRK